MIEETKGLDSYSPDAMIACPGCVRLNPPNRLSCIYCGKDLELDEQQKKAVDPVIRPAEPWEDALNLILMGGDLGSWNASSRIFGIEKKTIEVYSGASPVPIARTISRSSADLAVERAAGEGIDLLIAADGQMDVKSPPCRVRSLKFLVDGMQAEPFNDRVELPKSFEPSLIVVGVLTRKDLASTEKRGRSGDAVLDAAETGADEPVIDIYADGIAGGLRVRQDGFDFSCLGREKAFTAAENMRLLTPRIRTAFPGVRLDERYRRLRGLISLVWPPTETASAEGVERKSFGGYALKRVVSTDNMEQFTKYSRMLKLLNDVGLLPNENDQR